MCVAGSKKHYFLAESVARPATLPCLTLPSQGIPKRVS